LAYYFYFYSMTNLEETLKEIKETIAEHRISYLNNEQAVRAQLIEPILNSLGWKTSNPKFVRHNAPGEDGKIPDYTLLKNATNRLIVEAKNLSAILTDIKIVNQLSGYCYNQGVDFGVLTNGICWLLFNTFQRNPQDRIVWQINLEKDSVESVSRKLSSFAYGNIDELETLIQTNKALEKNWDTIITSIDSVVGIISQTLANRIKVSNPRFRIEAKNVDAFVKHKIVELFELTEDEYDENNFNKGDNAKSSETKFSEIEDNIFQRRKPKKDRVNISVTFPDKTRLLDPMVVETFLNTIKKVGPEKIKDLEIICSTVPLISEDKHPKYHQRHLDNYWVMVQISTAEKIKVLTQINERLRLNLKIETFINGDNAIGIIAN